MNNDKTSGVEETEEIPGLDDTKETQGVDDETTEETPGMDDGMDDDTPDKIEDKSVERTSVGMNLYRRSHNDTNHKNYNDNESNTTDETQLR